MSKRQEVINKALNTLESGNYTYPNQKSHVIHQVRQNVREIEKENADLKKLVQLLVDNLGIHIDSDDESNEIYIKDIAHQTLFVCTNVPNKEYEFIVQMLEKVKK